MSDSTKGSDRQTVDQAMIGIGDAVVAGFSVTRYAIEDRDGKSVTVVTVTSPHGVLFGCYEFTKVA
ncbi:hypothetical protein HCJ93_08460 [Streptomyces sp. SBST2-5]|uniref:Uncharacterized protein n=1 Tax=Streptomyces composti TaxID=2720025 RepID=A0ABX1A109_9ACTN|nr:hypothetical protein [Streptomyces composti]NJP50103.1 hypothetical protein [Streptomyces composti]